MVKKNGKINKQLNYQNWNVYFLQQGYKRISNFTFFPSASKWLTIDIE